MLELSWKTQVDLAESEARHGWGLFETLRILRGQPRFLPLHMERMKLGTRFLGMEDPPSAQAILEFLNRNPPPPNAVLRLMALDRHLLLSLSPLPPPLPGPLCAGIARKLRRLRGNPLTRYKLLSYADNRLLQREAQRRGWVDALALNEQGFITDGGRSNLFLFLEGTWWTPPASSGALPGIARRVLLEAGLAKIRPLTLQDLHSAQSAALSNSLRGIIPLQSLEGRPLLPNPALIEQSKPIFES